MSSKHLNTDSRGNGTAVSVHGLSKAYRIYDRPGDRLKEALHPLRKNYHRDFMALHDVSLEVHRGETVGIIGVNGSGKSTLLQAICGVLRPTAGEVRVSGTISALLELGSGFNPEFTGKENVFIQGAILGLSKAEVDRRYRSIVEFADIGAFIDQPVKTYSSGMLVRLAFSIAINVDPDILVVDEALSVGDVFFQAKCFNRLEALRRGQTTILLVSHEMNTVRSLCDRVVLLDGGRVVCDGDPRTVIETYFKRKAQTMGSVDLAAARPVEEPADADAEADDCTPAAPPAETPAAAVAPVEGPEALRYGNGKARLVDYTVNGLSRPRRVVATSGDEITVILEHQIVEDIEVPLVALMLRTPNGIELYGNNTTFNRVRLEPFRAGSLVRSAFRQRLYLNNGQYLLTLTIAEWVNDSVVYLDRYVDAVLLVVNGGPFPYSGICNLMGSVEVETRR